MVVSLAMSNKKRKLEFPIGAGKKAKLAEKSSAAAHSEPAPEGTENKKLSKKKEKRKLFKKELKKKLLKGGKLNWATKKKKKKAKMEVLSEASGDATISTAITSSTTAAPPKRPEEISANWRALQQALQKENGARKKKRAEFVPSRKTKPAGESARTVEKEPATIESKPEIWFEIDDSKLLEPSASDAVDKDSRSGETDASGESGVEVPTGITEIVGLDCEMVGVGEGGVDSILARVSIVNQHGHPVYDKYVKPTETVTDYRTEFSGIRPQNLREGALPFKTVQAEVAEILKNRVLVGHSLANDLQVLFLSHHHKKIRDTQKYKPFKKLLGGMPSLKKLAATVLNVAVQSGEHSSVEDAQTAMRLYMMHRVEWEKELREKKKKGNAKKADA